MKPLIDADILLHEIGWSGEFNDKETGEPILLDFDEVSKILDDKIDLICNEVGATQAPTLFVTDNEDFHKVRSKREELPPYQRGFRYDIAKEKPYKGTRKN